MTSTRWSDADTDAFAELLAGYCLEIAPGQQVLVRSTTLAAPLLRALQRAILAREAWPLLRPALPGLDEEFYALARDAQLDGYAPLARAEAEQADVFLSIQAPENTRALAGVDPARLARAARARAAARRAAAAEALVRDAVADAGRRPAGRHGLRRLRRLRARRALPRPRRPGGRLARAGRVPGRADRAADAGEDDPHRGRGNRPDAVGRRPHVGQLRRQTQHAQRRGLHRPDRGLGQRHDPLHDPLRARAASTSRT